MITKERAAGTYRLSAYYVSKMTAESPLLFALPLLFSTIVYWMGGLTVDAGSYFAYILTVLLHALTAQVSIHVVKHLPFYHSNYTSKLEGLDGKHSMYTGDF